MRNSLAILLSLIIYSNLWGQTYPTAVYGNVYIATNGAMRVDGALHLKAPANDSVAKVANWGALRMDTVIFYTNDTIEGLLMNRDTVLAPTNKVIVRKTFTKNNVWYRMTLPFQVDPNPGSGGVKNALTGAALTKGTDFQVQYYDSKLRSYYGKNDEMIWADFAAGGKMKRGYTHRVAVKWTAPATSSVVDFISETTDENIHLFGFRTKGSDLAHREAVPFENPVNSEGWNAIGGLNSTNYIINSTNIIYDGSIYYWNEGAAVWTPMLSTAKTGTLRPYGVMYVQVSDSISGVYKPAVPPTDPTGGFIFKNTGLTFDRTSTPVIRSSENLPYDLIELQLANPGCDYTPEIYFRFSNEYSKTFVKAEDHIVLDTRHDRVPLLWSLAKYPTGEANNELFVNSLPYGENEVPLGINAPLASEYIFSLRELTNTGIESVILLDKATGEETELRESDYCFRSGGGINTEERFVLFFNRASTAMDPASTPEIYAYAENNLLTVKNLAAGDPVQVVDLTGRTIASGIATGDTFTATVGGRGVYIVKARDGRTMKVLNK